MKGHLNYETCSILLLYNVVEVLSARFGGFYKFSAIPSLSLMYGSSVVVLESSPTWWSYYSPRSMVCVCRNIDVHTLLACFIYIRKISNRHPLDGYVQTKTLPFSAVVMDSAWI